MNNFRNLQKKHEQLLSNQQSDIDVTKEAQEYLELSKLAGSEIINSSERDQIRSNLRYWASYIYEKSGKFPNIELSSPSAKIVNQRKFTTLGLAALLISIVASMAIYSKLLLPINHISNITVTASYNTSPTVPSFTSTPFSVSPTATSENINISVLITYPQNGQAIPPEIKMKGGYSNLGIGQSICVFTQPLTKGGRIFPLGDCYTVTYQTSGDWSIAAKFGNKEDLLKPEKYILIIGIVTNNQDLEIIQQVKSTGFDELPKSILVSPQSVTVIRHAYITFDETRIVFSSEDPNNSNYEIYSTKLDGTDLQQLTFTSSMDELEPSISQDGKNIVVVGKQISSSQTSSLYQLVVYRSDGTSSSIINAERNTVFEHPLWSPNGKYIAYAAGTPTEVGTLSWKIYLYDIGANSSKIIEESKYPIRDFTWSPTGELIFADRGKITGTYDFFSVTPENPNDFTIYYNPNTEDTKPAISPNGKYLSYVVENTLYTVNLITKESKSIEIGSWVSSYPTWSPDSNTVFFTRMLNETASIWAVDIDGGNLRKVLEFGSNPYIGLLKIFLPVSPPQF